jgi:hypothetical protein
MTYVKPWHLIGVLSALGLIAVNTLPASPKRPDNPLQRSGSEDVAEIRGADLNYRIRGTGGIKVSMPRKLGWIVTAGDTYDINVDGSAIAGGFGAEHPSSDFAASVSKAYFLSTPATCLLPSAAQAAGKEVVICNTGASGAITYTTTDGQTISGQASGSVSNSTPYKIDRFISDGSNWFKE